MVHQKTYNAVILLLMLLLFFGCKKPSEEYTTARWEIVNPVTNEPYVGIPVRLILADNRGSSPEYDIIWQGETNSQGIAEYNFKAYMNTSFSYLEEANLAPLGTQGFDYSIVRRPSVGGMDKNEVNELRYEIVPYGEYVTHIKNINCQGSGDKMRHRRRYKVTGFSNDFDEWTPYNEGCFDEVFGVNLRRSDSVFFEIEVIRNNSTSIITKEFFIGPDKIDTLKIYY
jgi:hypothetical protein